MPLAGLGLHFLIAVCFAVHAVRTGQDRYWLIILFMFPLLGSLVYGIAIWLPEFRHSHAARSISAGVRRVLDPERELREAREAFEISPSANHRLRLAEALLAIGRAAEAATEFRAAMRNVHSDDPQIHVRLALALLEAGQPDAARDELDALRRAHPQFRSPDGHLVYARALADVGERTRAQQEFDALIGYYAGFEARARYAEALWRWGEIEAAKTLAQSSIKQARRLPAYSRRMNRSWLKRLEQLAHGETPSR